MEASLEQQLQSINSKLEIIGKQMDKLEAHICHVEAVYANVREPMAFVCDKIRNTYAMLSIPRKHPNVKLTCD